LPREPLQFGALSEEIFRIIKSKGFSDLSLNRTTVIQTDFSRLLIEGAAELGLRLTQEHMLAFRKYMDELKTWGKHMNLMSRSNDREIILKDFIDSLTVLKYLPHRASIIDLGSGAGFPGIPAKIVRPDLRVVLMEATRKKVFFLKNLVRNLGLEGIEIQWSEEKEKIREDLGGISDFVISRAFGSLLKLAATGLPLLRPGGILFAMKGHKGEAELEKDLPAMEQLGLKLDFFYRLRLPFLGHERILIGLRKA
jgi:16S rRNA (guanine527-N7)-methyltransferase